MTATVGWQSPLADIERAVQERAKNADLDMTAPGSTEALRALLELEVQHWQDEYRRGRRPIDIADPDRAVERGLRNLSAFGPLQPLLDDPDVWEVRMLAKVSNPLATFGDRQRQKRW